MPMVRSPYNPTQLIYVPDTPGAPPGSPGMPPTTNDVGSPGSMNKAAMSEAERKKLLYEQAAGAGEAAKLGQKNFNQLGNALNAQRNELARLASGQDSMSALQLQQGLQQNVAAQRSMAAGAAPQNAVAAARNASIQSARLGAGLAGQQAMAGIQERQGARQSLANLLVQQRGQELQSTTAGRGTSIQGYGTTPQQEKSWVEQYGPTIVGGLGAAAALSDERTKTNIAPAGGAALQAVAGVQPVSFQYRDPRAPGAGPGQQVGVTTQDLVRNGLGHTVVNTPGGQMVDAGKLSTTNTAALAALAQRVNELEGGRTPSPVTPRGPGRAVVNGAVGGGTAGDRDPRTYELTLGPGQVSVPSPVRRVGDGKYELTLGDVTMGKPGPAAPNAYELVLGDITRGPNGAAATRGKAQRRSAPSPRGRDR